MVRGLNYELLTTPDELMSIVPHLEPFGLDLIQSEFPIPDTFKWMDHQSPRFLRGLSEIGFLSRFYLPHRGEVAEYSALNSDVIEIVMRNHEIRSRAF